MEKIKDLFYDLSDIVLSLIIVVLIFGVVTWKISDVMKVPGVSVAEGENTYVSAIDETPTENKIDIVTVETDDDDVVIDESDKKDTASNETASDNSTSDSTKKVDTSTSTSDAKPVPTKKVFNITIDIPSGTTGFGISKILKSNGLISDTNEFLKVATNLELVNKMRSGTYDFSSDMSMEQMIKKLSGK